MSWPSFKLLSDAKDYSPTASKRKFNKFKLKREKPVAKPKKVYEPGEIHISDYSDDENTSDFGRKAKNLKFTKKKPGSKTPLILERRSFTNSTKTATKVVSGLTKFPVKINEVLDCNKSTKDSPKTATKVVSELTKFPVKINEVLDGNKSTTSNAVPARGVNSHIISEKYVGHCNFKKSSSQKPLLESQQIMKRDQIGANTKSDNNRNNCVGLHINYGDIGKQPSDKKLRISKGGYLETMRRILINRDSNRVFWNHELEGGLVVSECVAEVKSVVKSYGRTIGTLDIQGKEIQVIFFNNYLERFLSEGLKIKISLEGQPLHAQGTDVYLSINKVCKI